jgi:phosphohistidine swiveling domain-containing protein
MSNKIRHYMREEAEAVLPMLHDTYRAIGRFQNRRDARSECRLLKQLDLVGIALQKFKGAVQRAKRGYFDAVLDTSLSTSDRLVALDVAVGSMHIQFAVPRQYMHQESQELRRVLDACRNGQGSDAPPAPPAPPPSLRSEPATGCLCRGVAASGGTVVGQVTVVDTRSDYQALSSPRIVVSRMIRTEIIFGIQMIRGIVTDVGGSLSHAAIVAREWNIPCVVGTGNATAVLMAGMTVRVDGNAGMVHLVDGGGGR